jgi:hypothetical protein
LRGERRHESLRRKEIREKERREGADKREEGKRRDVASNPKDHWKEVHTMKDQEIH